MNRYVTYRDTNEENELLYFILQRDFPHYQCSISETPQKVFLDAFPLSSYNLWLVFAGCLRGMVIPSFNNVDKEILEVMGDMAIWFYENRILGNEKKYKKWKLSSN
jgi:hypothetical protein